MATSRAHDGRMLIGYHQFNFLTYLIHRASPTIITSSLRCCTNRIFHLSRRYPCLFRIWGWVISVGENVTSNSLGFPHGFSDGRPVIHRWVVFCRSLERNSPASAPPRCVCECGVDMVIWPRKRVACLFRHQGESCYCPGVVNFIGSTEVMVRVLTGGLKLFDINACVDVREESIGLSKRIPAMRIVERTVSVTCYRQFEIVYSDWTAMLPVIGSDLFWTAYDGFVPDSYGDPKSESRLSTRIGGVSKVRPSSVPHSKEASGTSTRLMTCTSLPILKDRLPVIVSFFFARNSVPTSILYCLPVKRTFLF